MAEVDMKGFNEAVRALERMGDNLESGLEDEFDDQVENLESQIRRFIESMGLVDTGALRDSVSRQFIPGTSGRAYRVKVGSRSKGVDYAKALEEGIDPHPIRPDEAGALNFVPEDTAPYPDYLVNEGGEYDGSVTVDWVMWKPDDPRTASGYGFADKAKTLWAPRVHRAISTRIDQEILRSGFRPSTGL